MILNQNSLTLDTTAFNVRYREQDNISNKISKMLPAVKDKVTSSLLSISKSLASENIQRLDVDRKQNKMQDDRYKTLTSETQALGKLNEAKFTTLYDALLTGKLNNKDLHFVELIKELKRDLRNISGGSGFDIPDLDRNKKNNRNQSRNNRRQNIRNQSKPQVKPTVTPKPAVAPKPTLASRATDTLSRGAKNLGGKALSGLGSAAKGLGGLARGAGAIATPLLVLSSATDAYQSYQEGDYQGAAEAGGGLVGGLAGAKLGGMAGAALGSIIPGAGTAIGGFLGGALGGVAGYFGGEELVSSVSDWFGGDEEAEAEVKEEKDDDSWFNFGWFDDDKVEDTISTPKESVQTPIALPMPVKTQEVPNMSTRMLENKTDETNSILANTSSLVESQLKLTNEHLNKIHEDLKEVGDDVKENSDSSFFNSVSNMYGSVKSFLFGQDAPKASSQSVQTTTNYNSSSYGASSISAPSYAASSYSGGSSTSTSNVTNNVSTETSEPDDKAAGQISKYAQIGGVDFSGLQPEMKTRFASAAKDYFEATGRKVKVTSAHRSDKKQAELWVRKHKLGDRSIYSVSRPKETTTIQYPVGGVMKTFTVQGSGRGSAHRPGLAVDISAATGDAAAFKPFAMKYGIVQPYPSNDPVHYELPKGSVSSSPDSTIMENSDGMKPTLNAPKESEVPAVPISPPPMTASGVLEENQASATSSPTTNILPQEESTSISSSVGANASKGTQAKPVINNAQTSSNQTSTTKQPSTVVSHKQKTPTKVSVTSSTPMKDLPTWVNDNSVQAFRIDPLTPMEG